MSETYTTTSAAPSESSAPTTRFSIPGALGLLYGIVNPVRYPGVAALQDQSGADVSYAGITMVAEEQRATSYLGTPIFFPVLLKGGEYNQYDRNGEVQKVRLDDFRMPLTTVVEMSRSKAMSKTPVVSAQSSVKEVYAHEDWDIRISGILMDEPKHPQGAETYAAQQERLLEFEALADSIQVDAELFHQREIYRIAIRSISFTQIPGKPGMHAFQMQCDSDDPLELILT
jgi:hypothetical protein